MFMPCHDFCSLGRIRGPLGFILLSVLGRFFFIFVRLRSFFRLRHGLDLLNDDRIDAMPVHFLHHHAEIEFGHIDDGTGGRHGAEALDDVAAERVELAFDELRADILKAKSLIPGTHRLNLHEIYGDFKGKVVAELTDIGFSTVDEVIAALVKQLPKEIPVGCNVQFRLVNCDSNQEVVYERSKGKGF